MRLSYVASTAAGDRVTGSLEAPSTQDALRRLRERGLTPLDLRQHGWLSFGKGRVKGMQAAQILRRLAAAVTTSGVPLAEVLPALVQEESVPAARSLLSDVQSAVMRETVPLSAALARFPQVFPVIVTKRLAVGEASGDLGPALEDAARFMDHNVQARSKIIRALIYPAAILAMAIGIVTVVSITIVPRFAAFYTQAGARLPLPTQLVVSFGALVADAWWLLVALIFGAVWAARQALARQDVRDRLDYVRWRLWLWRRIERALAWSTWANAVALMYVKNTQLLDALQLACEASGTAVIRDIAPLLRRRVVGKTSLRDAMAETGVFPAVLLTQVGIGERQGTLAELLKDAALWYEREADMILSQLPEILQPVAIVIVGCIIGFMVFSMYLPMFGIYHLIQAP